MVSDYKSLLTNKKFIYIWVSQFFSQLTINIMNFVLLIRLYEITNSAISTSLLWVAFSLPAILIGPMASGIIDLTDKKKMLVWTNLLQALTIFFYAISASTRSNVFFLYEIVFLYSLLNQFYVPAEASTLPIVLKKKELARGNGLFFVTQQGTLLLGFGLGGILKSLIGFEGTLFISSFFLFIAFISTVFLPHFSSYQKIHGNFEDAIIAFFRHIFEGYNYIRSEKKILTPFFLLLGFQVALQLCIIQFPILAQDILSIPLNSAGFFILVPAGLGAVIASLVIPKILSKKVRKKSIINFSFLSMGILIACLTYLLPLFLGIAKLVLAFLIIAGIGISFVGILIPSQTFLQETTPPNLRGRVFGNFWFLVTVTSVIPVVFSGSIIEFFGIHFLLTFMFISVLVIYYVSVKFGDRFLSD